MQTAQIADGDRWSRTSRWARGKAGELFGADLRSLAALRIALAVIVLADLAGRARHLTVHYTDDGVLPRSAALRELSEWQISLHLMNGTTYVQAMLLGATALAALALLVGYRTRPMSVIVWAMMLSLQWRNPAVLSDADTLLRLLLFWAMFLPLGARWSVDRARAGAPALVSTRFLSLGTFALFMQIAFVYWFTVLLKTSDKWREDGSALYYAMMNDQFTTSLGASLRPHDTLLQILTFATLGIEAIGPFLLFCPVFTWRIRTATVAAFMGLHLGILLTMDIGLFPWLSALCMVGFLPSRFWEAAIPRVQAVVPRLPSVVRQPRAAWDRLSPVNWQPFRTRLAALGGAWRPTGAPLAASAGAGALGDFPLRSSPPSPSAAPPGAGAEPTRARSSPLINLLAAACLLYVFGWNLMTVSDFQVPDSLRPAGNVLGLKQSWDMFSPQPNTTPGWFVVPGVLADGEQVDLVLVAVHDDPARVRPVSWERPDDFSDIFSDKYWRKYLMAMRDDSNLRTSFARYVCREWNATHDGSFRLVGLEIVYVRQQTLPDQQWGEPRRDKLSEHTC